MPKKPNWLKHKDLVYERIINGQYIDGIGKIVDPLPSPDDVRDVMEEYFKVYSDRSFRIILVEDYNDYKIFIQIPDGKSSYDFYVWRAILKDGVLDIKVPTHDDLAKFYVELRSKNKVIEEYLINATIKLVHVNYRWGIPRIILYYFNNIEEELKREIGKFLSTLKWIALQEDINYPPKEKKMGSKYALAIYALLEAGFSMNEIRRVIKFR
ncbi:MAG: hypothetical protein NO475_05745 [Candidatus Methanomethylicia archaeon]|nr:hypothetical protein [Candidatus Methanomethylicia archaeon]